MTENLKIFANFFELNKAQINPQILSRRFHSSLDRKSAPKRGVEAQGDKQSKLLLPPSPIPSPSRWISTIVSRFEAAGGKNPAG